MTLYRKIVPAALILIFVFSLCAPAGEAALKPADDVKGPEKDKEEPLKKNEAQNEPEEVKTNYDWVKLKNDEAIEGHVIDSGGPTIEIKFKKGSRFILKSDIKEIKLGKGRQIDKPKEDIVFMTDGPVLIGKVRVDATTGKIHLKRKTSAGEGETVLDPKKVRRIIYSDPGKNRPIAERKKKTEPEASPLIAGSIKKRLEDLAGDDADKVASAREELIKFGIFADAAISKAFQSATGIYKSRLRKLIKLAALKRIVAPDIIIEFPDIYDCLMNTKFEPKFETLQLIQMLYPEYAPQLLVHVALDSVSENEHIRYYCVKQLNGLNHPQELITILEEADTPLAVLAAIYLGDRGILLGLPLLIEALDMKDEKIRKLAIEKLRQYTRQDFGGTPYDPPETRKKTILRWREWLKENEEHIQRQATIVRNEDIPEKDRDHSNFLHRQGQIVFEHGNTNEALFLFEEALRHNPANVAAHMNIAVLLYQEMEDYVGARERLLKLLKFYSDRVSTTNLRDIFFHLGMIALSNKNWEDAQKHFMSTTLQDNRFTKGHIALAESYLAQLDRDKNLLPKPSDGKTEVEIIAGMRERLLKDSLKAYKEAESLISGTRKALKDEDFVAAWREGAEQLDMDKSAAALRPKMITRVPEDLIKAQRQILRKRHARALLDISRCHEMLEDTGKAIKTLEKAVEMAPENTEFLSRMAMLYQIDGSLSDAARTYEKILEIEPENSDARKNLEELRKHYPKLAPEKK